jgi:hypothetical protein
MGERDAFGREVGEDSLADLGWKTPQSAAKPSVSSPFDAGEAWSVQRQPAGRPPRPPRPPRARRRRRGGFSTLIFVVALLVIFGASAGSLLTLGGEVVDRGEKALRDAIPTAPPASGEATPEAVSLGDGSLLEPANLRKALARLPDGRVTVLTVRQDGLDGTVNADGRTTVVHMTADGQLTTVKAPVAVPGKSVRLNPAVPARIVRTVTRRTGLDPGEISQLILANGRWTLQFPDGQQFTANAKGTKVRRIT